MTDWRKYEVPDWVVDDYNSRVSEKDRMPLGSYGDMGTEDDSYDSYVKIPMTKYGSYQRDRKKAELLEQEAPKLEEAIKGLLLALLQLLGSLLLYVVIFILFLLWLWLWH